MEDLPRISYVVLGVLSLRPGSGYDIKAMVDHSTRHFWAASYGQIYPELKRLTAAGLVEGEDAAQGERARTVHRLTPAGRERLRAWLRTPEAGVEVRHEGLLKLFFADALDDEDGLRDKVVAIRAHYEAVLTQLEDIAAAKPAISPATGLVLDYGLGIHRWVIGWCTETERRLAAGADAGEGGG